MQFQDSTHPTGVNGPQQKMGDPGSALSRSRNRKANAAVQMRLSGAEWAEIATALGYPTPRQAIVAVERALEKQLQSSEDREKMRRLAGARLERLLRSVWVKAIDPNHPDHLLAATKAREIIDRHIKLYGLDAPSEVIVHSPTRNELEQWVAQVVALREPEVEEYDIVIGEADEVPPTAIGE